MMKRFVSMIKKKAELGKPVKRTAVKKDPLYAKPVKIGCYGPEVLWICVKLRAHGSTIKLTDKFHIGMRSAVICFQKKNKLPVTGVVDKKTWMKLAAK